MRSLDVLLFEPGDMLGTAAADGKIRLWVVADDGSLVPHDEYTPAPTATAGASAGASTDPIEGLDLSVRAYNVLKREHLDTIEALLSFVEKHGEDGIWSLRNIGATAAPEILDHVARLRRERTASVR